MGIAYSLVRAKPDVIETLRGRPRAVADFLFGDPDLYEQPQPGLFARWFGCAKTSVIEDVIDIPDRYDDDETDLDKSWHIVHYLLTGEVKGAAGPLGLIMDDQDPIALVDLGLGKPSVISPHAVKAFAEAATALSDKEFLTRFDPKTMPVSKLYLGKKIISDDVEAMQEYVLENFHCLREFAVKAAREGEAIITYYC